jgi:prepilin-type N-terminal cleavage/methylation domain-containing protein
MISRYHFAPEQAGFTLLEVVLAIAVFAFGMLALIELQTGLARSSSDANNRTVAVSIAEELAEAARGFTGIAAVAEPPGEERVQYDEIVTERLSLVSRGDLALTYEANIIVQDYYWDAETETFVDERPVGIVRSDYKTMDIVVMWRDFDADVENWENHDSICFERLNNLDTPVGCTDEFDESLYGGGIRIVETVPSAPPVLGAVVASSREYVGGPQVIYNPGENPEIIKITLDADGGKFKESTSPTPDVIREDEAVETWFDVVTYSQAADADSIFLRREEFVVVSCQCRLDMSPASVADYGFKPTLWNGVTYTEGERVFKPVGGIPAGIGASAQSAFCTTCCRDHHDGAGSGPEDVYNRANEGSDADHPHYTRNKKGVLDPTPVGDGGRYVEACRLIRKDGFMRVTQDANQRTLIGFPEGYLDFDEGVTAYSTFVTESAGSYYTTGQTDFPQPNPPDPESSHVFPARTTATATVLPDIYSDPNSQQLRARAVYTDYLTAAAQQVIDKCFADPPEADCPTPAASTPFEIYPFFDLQMTLLARWKNASLNDLVAVTNEPIETGNAHSRGFLELNLLSEEAGLSRIQIDSQTDNLGLTATGAIDFTYDFRGSVDSLYVNANDGEDFVPPIGTLVSGQLRSSVPKAPAADLLLEADSGVCSQTDTEWSCVVEAPGTITVSNYYLKIPPGPRTWACSELTYLGEIEDLDPDLTRTVFELPTSGTYDIWITDDFVACER